MLRTVKDKRTEEEAVATDTRVGKHKAQLAAIEARKEARMKGAPI